jgi:hypothetical protein
LAALIREAYPLNCSTKSVTKMKLINCNKKEITFNVIRSPPKDPMFFSALSKILSGNDEFLKSVVKNYTHKVTKRYVI